MKNAADMLKLTIQIQLLHEEIKNVKVQHAEEKSEIAKLQDQSFKTMRDAFRTV